MQLSGFEHPSQEAHNGQLWQTKTQDGRRCEDVVPKEGFGPLRVR